MLTPAARPFLVALSLLALPCTSRGQIAICTLNGQKAMDRMGTSVGGAGDRLMAGAPGGTVQGLPPGTGTVTVMTWSRSTGSQNPFPSAIPGSASGNQFGTVIANAGPDTVIVGAPLADPPGLSDAGLAVVMSTTTGARLHAFPGLAAGDHAGSAVAVAGDVDGDSFTDYLVGAPDGQGGTRGQILVYSSNPASPNGGYLFNEFGFSGTHWGSAVAGLGGDVDADGKDDFLIGVRTQNRLYVYGTAANGAKKQIRAEIIGSGEYGWAVLAMGDLNGDSLPDYAASAPGANRVDLRDGTTGDVLRSFQGIGGRFGEAIAAVGDQDGDGSPELLVGAPDAAGGDGEAYLYSTQSGILLAVMRGNLPGGRFGASVSGLGDLTGDGRAEFIVGAPDASPPDPNDPASTLMMAGQALAFSLDDDLPGQLRFGNGCLPSTATGPQPRIGTPNGAPAVGFAGFSLGVTGTPVNGLAAIALDFAVLTPALDLSFISGLSGCTLYVDAYFSTSVPTLGTTTVIQPGLGYGVIDLPIPADPILKDLRFYAQWYVVDPGPLPIPGSMSKAIQLDIR